MTTHKTPAGKLTEDGVREIRRRRTKGETLQAIANTMGLSIATVFNVTSGKTWAWLS